MIELKIYVPKPGTWPLTSIARGSGIVGIPNEDTGCVSLSYEGAVHGQRMSWEAKVFHAVSRLVLKYPSVAKMTVNHNDLIEVGVFRCQDDWSDKVYEITDQEALDTWIK